LSLAVEVLRLIEDFEGYLRKLNDGTDRVAPYRCPAGVPTIGVGSTRYSDGRRVQMSDPPISKAYAYECLNWELRDNEASVDRLSPRKMHPWMRGPLVSFVYNCGNGAYQGSGLRKAVNDGRWSDVPGQFAKWRMGGGRVLPGLVRRRKAEAAMFMRGVERMQAGDFGEPDPVPEVVPAPAAPNPANEPKFNIPPTVWGRLWEWLWK
jgi:lysozyme